MHSTGLTLFPLLGSHAVFSVENKRLLKMEVNLGSNFLK